MAHYNEDLKLTSQEHNLAKKQPSPFIQNIAPLTKTLH